VGSFGCSMIACHKVPIQCLSLFASITTTSGSLVPSATAAIPERRRTNGPRVLVNPFHGQRPGTAPTSQRMGSLKSSADFFARAPPSLCNSVHSPPRAHPPRASCSRFAWTLPTKANSRSFGDLKRSHSAGLRETPRGAAPPRLRRVLPWF